MNKIFFAILFCTSINYSQTNKDSIILLKKHEIKATPLSSIFGGNLNLSYEYFKNKDFSFGMETILNLREDEFEYSNYYNKTVSYQVIPYVRYSLSEKQTSFFYTEGYLSLNGGKYKSLDRLNDEFGNAYYLKTINKYTDLAIGFGGGYKFYFKQTIGLDFNLGFATNLFNKNSLEVIPKGNILLSYRF